MVRRSSRATHPIALHHLQCLERREFEIRPALLRLEARARPRSRCVAMSRATSLNQRLWLRALLRSMVNACSMLTPDRSAHALGPFDDDAAIESDSELLVWELPVDGIAVPENRAIVATSASAWPAPTSACLIAPLTTWKS